MNYSQWNIVINRKRKTRKKCIKDKKGTTLNFTIDRKSSNLLLADSGNLISYSHTQKYSCLPFFNFLIVYIANIFMRHRLSETLYFVCVCRVLIHTDRSMRILLWSIFLYNNVRRRRKKKFGIENYYYFIYVIIYDAKGGREASEGL